MRRFFNKIEITEPQRISPDDIPKADVEALLDYLHGDTPAAEVELAAEWEYSRRERSLVELSFDAKRERQQGHASGRMSGEIFIWQLESFPFRNWRDISSADKKRVRFRSAAKLPVADVRHLHALGALDTWKRQATDPERKGLLPARTKGFGPFEFVTFAMDYSQAPKTLTTAFESWMNDQKQLFERHAIKRTGRGRGNDQYVKDLHDLAVWWLDTLIGFHAAQKWTKDNRRGRRLFWRHQNRSGAIYNDRRDWDAAVGRAKDSMRRRFPAYDEPTFLEVVIRGLHAKRGNKVSFAAVRAYLAGDKKVSF